MKTCLLLLFVASVSIAPLPHARAQAGGLQYIVQPGDTLYNIALNFGVSLDALQAANPGVDPAALAIGQPLIIPGFEGVNGQLMIHRLEAGESLASLSARFGVPPQTIVKLNRLVNPDRLYLNEPMVLVDQADQSAVISAAMTYAAQPGESLLTFAAAHGQNAWALSAVNGAEHPGAVVPGALVFVPGGAQPPTALPYPAQTLEIAPFPLVQGTTFGVKLTAAEPISVSGVFSSAPLRFIAAGDNTYSAVQGVYRLTDPNLYPLTLQVGDWLIAQSLPVRLGDYLVDRPLTVDPQTIDPAVTGPENLLVANVVSPTTPIKYWEGPLAYPSVGSFRSMYGALRSYNGSPYIYFHTGVDFSGGDDRPITAPAPGVVVFTGALTVRGNATIIDHGWGVFTGYWHQSQILVNVGDAVQTGQILGYNGSTGRVTGPHLHWELFVGGAQVNPLQWTEQTFP